MWYLPCQFIINTYPVESIWFTVYYQHVPCWINMVYSLLSTRTLLNQYGLQFIINTYPVESIWFTVVMSFATLIRLLQFSWRQSVVCVNSIIWSITGHKIWGFSGGSRISRREGRQSRGGSANSRCTYVS